MESVKELKAVPMPEDGTIVAWRGMKDANLHDEVRTEMATWMFENWAGVGGDAYLFTADRVRLVRILNGLTVIQRAHELVGGGLYQLIEKRCELTDELIGIAKKVDGRAADVFRTCL